LHLQPELSAAQQHDRQQYDAADEEPNRCERERAHLHAADLLHDKRGAPYQRGDKQ